MQDYTILEGWHRERNRASFIHSQPSLALSNKNMDFTNELLGIFGGMQGHFPERLALKKVPINASQLLFDL